MRTSAQWLLVFLFLSYTNTCLSQDGLLDRSFGIGGIVTTVVNMHDDAAVDLAIQEDGKIIAAGVSSDGNYYGYADFSPFAIGQ